MARRGTAALLAVALLAPAGPAWAQERRLEHVKPVAGGLEGSGRWALIVGIDEYQSPKVERLAGAVADAQAVRDALVKYAEFPAQQAILLTSNGKLKPTTRAILTKLEEIRQATQPGDLLLFFFAGHGVEVDGQRYLLGHDADISGPGALKATSLAASALMHELETIRATHRVIMVDACRNDPTKGSRRANVADEGFEAAFTLAPTREGGVRATLLSTSKGQSAYEWTEKRRGFFSYFIEKGIAGEAANRGKVTLTSLIDYLNESVPQAVRQYRNREQTPYAKFEGPPFVLVRGERLPVTVAALDRQAAPATRVIYGVVKDSAGAPLRGATVSVAVPKGTARALVHEPSRGGSANEIATTTDEDGFFRIEGLPADADLKLTAAMQSYMVRTVSAPAAENGKKISLFLPSEGAAVVARRTVEPPPAPPTARPPAPPPPKAAPAKPAAQSKAEIAAARKAEAEAKARAEAERKAQAEAEARAQAAAEAQARQARVEEVAQAAYRTFLVEDFREAEKLARQALEGDADNALANAVLANAMMAGVQGRQDGMAAKAFADRALQRDPSLALAHNALGLVLVAGGDLGGARAAFQRAVQLDPRLGVAHGNLGYVHWQQKRYPDARRAFEQAAELSPDSAIPHNGLSTVLHSMGRFGDAEKECRKAISRYQLRDESLASFYVQLAVALYEQRQGKPGKHEQAREAVARAKALGLDAHPAYAIIEGGKASS